MLKADPHTWEAAEQQAAHLWLTAYQPAPDAPNLETVRGYLEAFDHCYEAQDWDKTKNIFFNSLDKGNKLYWQLGIWGYYSEQTPI
ncbi:MAG: hypothetical protein HC929_24960, partial [Leptolyngbyaceae cyanobacterium SM2_5_2]|nr:hypothetical protein [Leptolyngbyaceae cyanobacterium SM2_5_2]